MSQTRRAFMKSAALLGGAPLLSPALSLAFDDGAQERKAAPGFVAAKPVWAKDREKEMNVTLRFAAEVSLPDGAAFDGAIFRATGSSIMRVYINGEYACYGPARGPRGWFRVDEWQVGKYLRPGVNEIAIEIAG